MAKQRSGKLPTSFNLDPRLVHRLRVACASLGVKISPFVDAALTDWVARADAGEVQVTDAGEPQLTHTATAPAVLAFPHLLAELSDDDVWLVHQLVAILRDRPQGDVFVLLLAAAHKAAKAYIAQHKPRPGSPPLPKSGKGQTESGLVKSLGSITEGDIQWLELLLQVLHSRKPGLPTAVQNNLHEFAWADEAWQALEAQESPLVSLTRARAGGRRPTPPQLAEIARTPGHSHDPGERTAGSGAKLDAVEKADQRSADRAKHPARKTRQGS